MKISYLFTLLLILLPILVFFALRGVVIHDEGYILYSAEKILQGLLPYRDFSLASAPLSIFITTLSFYLFGPSILSSRILMTGIALFSCFLIYRIIMFATKNKLYATLAVLLFVAWGPTHINFSWLVMYAILLGMLTSFLLLKFLDTRLERYLFFAGLAAFSVFLAKQNFGIVLSLPIAVLFLVRNMRRIRYLLAFGYGYIWGVILFGCYLLITSSFAPFVNDFYFFTIRWIIIHKSLTTPFIYSDNLISMVLRTTLYLLPAILSIAAIVLLFLRRRFHLIFLPVLTLVFYIAGIRPTTDYVHLVPLLALIGIPTMLYLRFNISTEIRFLIFIFTLAMIIFGFYTALFKGYYRWDAPLISHNNFSNISRINIFLNDKFFKEFLEIADTVDKFTKKGEFIYVDSFNPLIYFVTARREATNYSYLGVGVDAKEYYDHVIGNLVAKDVKLIFLNHKGIDSHPIKEFLLKYYKFHKTIQDFDVYVRF